MRDFSLNISITKQKRVNDCLRAKLFDETKREM